MTILIMCWCFDDYGSVDDGIELQGRELEDVEVVGEDGLGILNTFLILRCLFINILSLQSQH